MPTCDAISLLFHRPTFPISLKHTSPCLVPWNNCQCSFEISVYMHMHIKSWLCYSLVNYTERERKKPVHQSKKSNVHKKNLMYWGFWPYPWWECECKCKRVVCIYKKHAMNLKPLRNLSKWFGFVSWWIICFCFRNYPHLIGKPGSRWVWLSLLSVQWL